MKRNEIIESSESADRRESTLAQLLLAVAAEDLLK